MESLKVWNRQDNNKTYTDFKIHIRKEYNELRKVGALTIQQSQLNPQVNNVQEPTTDLTSAITSELRSTIMDVIISIQQVPEETMTTPTNPQANNVGANDPVIQLTKMVQTLQEKVDKMTKPPAPPKNINLKTGKSWKRYCHRKCYWRYC